MSGPTSVPFFRPSPSFIAARAIDQPAEELVVDARLQDQPARRRAALARRAERAPEHAVEREIEVGVVHDDHRVLAAHLERQALVHPAAGLADEPPVSVDPVNETTGTSRMLDDRRADVLAEAVHELDHLGRQPRLEHDLDEHVPGVRHVLGRLEDARVSADAAPETSSTSESRAGS